MASDNGWPAATATKHFYPLVGSGKEEREWIELEPFHDGDKRREFRFIGGWRGQCYPSRRPFVNYRPTQRIMTIQMTTPSPRERVIANNCLWVADGVGVGHCDRRHNRGGMRCMILAFFVVSRPCFILVVFFWFCSSGSLLCLLHPEIGLEADIGKMEKQE